MDMRAFIENLEGLSNLQKFLLLAVFVLIGVGSFASFDFLSKRERISSLREEINTLETFIAANRSLAARLPQFDQEIALHEHKLAMAKMLLPEDVHERERLLAAIERLGMEVGVEFLLFQPGEEVKQDFYASREVQLRMRGEFHNLMIFFDRVARLDRLVSLDRLRLQPLDRAGPGPAGPGPVVLNARSVIQVYRALSEQEIKAAEEAQKQQAQQQGRQ